MMVMFISRYKMINLVGDGTYGLVYLAYNQESKEKVILSFFVLLKKNPQVAIKTMKRKYHSWSEVMDLREVGDDYLVEDVFIVLFLAVQNSSIGDLVTD